MDPSTLLPSFAEASDLDITDIEDLLDSPADHGPWYYLLWFIWL